jgi:hypothetical protein
MAKKAESTLLFSIDQLYGSCYVSKLFGFLKHPSSLQEAGMLLVQGY